MSGKAPPKGPRALLGTQLGSSSSPASLTSLGVSSHPHQQLLYTQPQPQRPPPSAPTLNINTRIGATPPTGPRSLQIGRPSPGLKYSLNSHTTLSSPNGLGPHSLQTNRFPVSIKGKKRDTGTSSGNNNVWQSNHPQPNGCQDSDLQSSNNAVASSSSTSPFRPLTPLSLSPAVITRPGELKHDRAAVTIPMQPKGPPRDRPTPLLESPPPPPPPPPPNYDPPPPPPPSQPPPPPPPPPPLMDLDIQPPPPPSPPVEIQPPSPRSLSLLLPTHSDIQPPPPAIEPLDSCPIPPITSPPTSPPPPRLPPLPPTSPPPPPPRSNSPSPLVSPSLPPTLPPPPPPPLLLSDHPSPPPLETSFLPSESPPLPTASEPPSLVRCSEALSEAFSQSSLSPIPQEHPPQPPFSSPSRPPSPKSTIVLSESFRPSSLPPRPTSSPPPHSVLWYNSNRRKESSSRSRPPEPEPPKKWYSTPPLLPWPPPRSDFPHHRPFKVLYDPAIDSPLNSASSTSPWSHNSQSYPGYRPPSYYRALMEHVRKHASSASVVQERIRGNGKGKEILYRCEGEVVGPAEPDDGMKEEEIVVKDPRKENGFKKPHAIRSLKTEFIELPGYEYDEHSAGPPPPLSVLIAGISPLTPNPSLRRNFQQYGSLVSFEPQIDKENGSALGILFLKFSTHEEAKRCVEKEHGRKGGLASLGKPGELEEWKAVLDGEGSKLKAVMKELDDRKRREKVDKRRGKEWGSPFPNGAVNPVASGSSSATGKAGKADTPLSGKQSPATRKGPNLPPHPRNSQQRPSDINGRATHSRPDPPVLGKDNISSTSRLATGDSPPQNKPDNKDNAEIIKPKPSAVLDPTTAALQKARESVNMMEPGLPSSKINSNATRGRNMQSKYEGYKANTSRSPSPMLDAPRPETKSVADREKDHQEVIRELAENGHDHVMIPGGVQWMAIVKDEDVTVFFDGFNVDKILRDHTAIYVTFEKPGVAQRAAMFLGSGMKQLGYQPVTVSVHHPPANPTSTKKTYWEESEMIGEAQNLIVQELRSMLERDISDKLVGQELKKFFVEERSKATSTLQREQKPLEKKGLKGLSFKKQVKEELKAVEEAKDEEEEDIEEEKERPKKKRKGALVKRPSKVVDAEDIESEEEDEDDLIKLAILDPDVARKRTVSEDREDDEPVKKKQKVMKVKVKGKKSLTKIKQDATDEVVLMDTELYQAPAVTHLYTSGFDSSLSPSRSPSPIPVHKRRKRLVTPPPPSPPPPPEPVGLGLCDDDEDLYFVKLALSKEIPITEKVQLPPSSPDVPTFRKHASGSARTEGYYKITHAEKVAYVVQYQARAANAPAPVDEPQPQHVTSSRSNRASARRRAQGLEEINQVQRAVALSKGENAANELTFKFNQLQTRKKHLRFARSPIHDWGLYAMEKISRGEMVIEYVGEVIRAQVADKREKAYERQGIGSSYLFRIDEDLVVDATKKGNLGRLINHSCDPNCTAKIITISGEKKIVIYAKQEIELGDEITYDYHFPFEQDKIPCLCGSAKCRGYLN